MLRIVVRNRIIFACDLQVVADRWWNHELELMATKVISRILLECGESGWIWWKAMIYSA